MTVRSTESGLFQNPSPGEILKRKDTNHHKHELQLQNTLGRECVANNPLKTNTDIEISLETFRSNFLVSALKDRGVILAPLLVQWSYRVQSAKHFSKWLKTKELLLSSARLGIHPITSNIRYFGTYIEQGLAADEHAMAIETSVCGQTLWGFDCLESMTHMFQLCRGNVERINIVETDLKDFVLGLKSQIAEVGLEHFSQRVFVVPATL